MTKEEIKFCEYKSGISGSFTTSLIDTFWLADFWNKHKLMDIFPILKVANRFSNEEGYWQDLVEEWNEAHPNYKLS